MIWNTRQLRNALDKLLEKFIICVDEDGQEYSIDCIGQCKRGGSDDYEWCYAIKLKKCSNGYFK